MDGTGNTGVPHAAVLLAFADAAATFDATAIAPTRAAVLSAMGQSAMIDAAAVVAGFNGITRIADATGIPLEDAKAEETVDWRAALGIDDYARLKS